MEGSCKNYLTKLKEYENQPFSAKKSSFYLTIVGICQGQS